MTMRSSHPLRNGETPLQSPNHRDHRFLSPNPQFRSTVAEQKLRRFNSLIFVLRLTSFSFSVASSLFMLTNTRGGEDSPHWYDFGTFRLVLAANGIVALYSLFELGAAVWEISRNLTVLPEVLQVWFDFGHDQVFAYLLLSACSAGASLAKTMRKMDTCTVSSAFCLQADISIALGFVAFLFLGLTSLLSGFRVVCFIINGSRFHLKNRFGGGAKYFSLNLRSTYPYTHTHRCEEEGDEESRLLFNFHLEQDFNS